MPACPVNQVDKQRRLRGMNTSRLVKKWPGGEFGCERRVITPTRIGVREEIQLPPTRARPATFCLYLGFIGANAKQRANERLLFTAATPPFNFGVSFVGRSERETAFSLAKFRNGRVLKCTPRLAFRLLAIGNAAAIRTRVAGVPLPRGLPFSSVARVTLGRNVGGGQARPGEGRMLSLASTKSPPSATRPSKTVPPPRHESCARREPPRPAPAPAPMPSSTSFAGRLF